MLVWKCKHLLNEKKKKNHLLELTGRVACKTVPWQRVCWRWGRSRGSSLPVGRKRRGCAGLNRFVLTGSN